MFKYLSLIFIILLNFSVSSKVHATYGNGFLIYNILHDLFGPASEPILQESILYNISAFGGTCSLMEENKGKDVATHNAAASIYSCKNGFTESKNKSYTSNLIKRNALIMNSCHEITFNNNSFKFFLRRHSQHKNINDKARSIYNSFYPLEENPRDLTNKILTVLKKEKFKNNEQNLIREFTYLVCISEKWQQL
jgi:hypothetical protein